MEPRRLVLASGSRYRAELLRRLEVEFLAEEPRVDEREFDRLFEELEPGAFALRLAREKAASLRGAFPEALILGADQIGVLEGRGRGRQLLTKPGTVERAVEQLLEMSGREHQLITGVVLLDAESGTTRVTVDRQRLKLRALERAEVLEYVERHRPLDCAGGYRIEDAGIKLFEKIESEDYTGIIGLPLLAVAQLLREVGLL